GDSAGLGYFDVAILPFAVNHRVGAGNVAQAVKERRNELSKSELGEGNVADGLQLGKPIGCGKCLLPVNALTIEQPQNQRDEQNINDADDEDGQLGIDFGAAGFRYALNEQGAFLILHGCSHGPQLIHFRLARAAFVEQTGPVSLASAELVDTGLDNREASVNEGSHLGNLRLAFGVIRGE